MSFQFGTNWPGFMERVGNIAGPLLGYEVLTAFFLEATFLGIMLFGMARSANGCTCWPPSSSPSARR
jgi:cytochrome d ubiquinol oxidase subunit I